MQSKFHSFLESVANIFVGFAIGVASQMFIFPFFGINITFSENILMGLFFTVVSLVRSYALRRVFNRWHMSLVQESK